MARGLKICVIGGASTYTPELIEGFIDRQAELGLLGIALMDIDARKLRVVGSLAERMLKAAGSPIQLLLSTEREQALEGADYVISQIRVGGNAQRVVDEKIPLRFGIVGQETTGPGGFAKALRSIPVMLSIASDMERLCPSAWLVNFTNPSGLITEALSRHSKAQVIGLCNLPVNMICAVAEYLGVSPQRISLDYVGLNHLSWAKGMYLDGRDVTKEVLTKVIAEARQNKHGEEQPPFSPKLIEALAMLPCYYLRYYYHHDEVLEEEKKAVKTRGEEVQEIEENRITGLAPLLFKAAYAGDEVACQLVKEVGTELGISARAIIRRLSLEDEDVEVVLAGSIFKAEGALLIDTIKQVIHEVAPQASIVLPKFEPVAGALFLALEAAGVEVKGKVKDNVKATLPKQLVIER